MPTPNRSIIGTSSLLTDLESCTRKGYFASRWDANRLLPRAMLTRAINLSVTAQDGQEYGEVAGSQVMQDAEDRGLDTDVQDVYGSVVHLAALSDILVSVIRKPNEAAWLIPPPVQNWTSQCFISPDGSHLRRIVMVSNWSDPRHYSECRSWFTLGEIAAYNLPMQMIVLILGPTRNGKVYGPWTQGYRHPMNRQLRFRKRSKGSRAEGNVFNDKWEKIWREDHDDIKRETWLQGMLTDDVLPEVCFKVDVAIPAEKQLRRIRDMRDRKLERLYALKEKPEANLSTCDWPTPCVFRRMCHILPERNPSERTGFIRIG